MFKPGVLARGAGTAPWVHLPSGGDVFVLTERCFWWAEPRVRLNVIGRSQDSPTRKNLPAPRVSSAETENLVWTGNEGEQRQP